MLLCKDCDFYLRKWLDAPMCTKFLDPVDGSPLRSCSSTRRDYTYCGNEGKNFQVKPVKISWFKFPISSFYS